MVKVWGCGSEVTKPTAGSAGWPTCISRENFVVTMGPRLYSAWGANGGGVFHGRPFSPPRISFQHSQRIMFQTFLAGLCRNRCLSAMEKWREIAVRRMGLIGGSLNPEAEIIWRISQLGPAGVKFMFCYLLYCQSFWDHSTVVVPCNSFETSGKYLLQSFVSFSVGFSLNSGTEICATKTDIFYGTKVKN